MINEDPYASSETIEKNVISSYYSIILCSFVIFYRISQHIDICKFSIYNSMNFTFVAKLVHGDLFDYIEIFNCQLISLTEFFNIISSYYTYINILSYLVKSNVIALWVVVYQKYLCLLLCKLIVMFVQTSSKISFLPKDADNDTTIIGTESLTKEHL